MIELNARSKDELISCIKKIDNSTYDEKDIVVFLRNVRPLFSDQELIWELASFIAHPEPRDRGIFHKNMDVVYAQLLYVHANVEQRKLQLLRIEKNVFETFILGSINAFDNKKLLNKFNKNKKDCLKIVKEKYKKEGDFFVIQDMIDFNAIFPIIWMCTATMEIKKVIENQSLIKQIQYVLKELKPLLNIEYDERVIIDREKNNLIVCIMCLLHSSSLKLFDNEIGKCNIAVSKTRKIDNNNNVVEGEWSIELIGKMRINSIDVLYILMSLEEDISRYFKQKDLFHITEYIPTPIFLHNYNAIRDEDGNLIIDKAI